MPRTTDELVRSIIDLDEDFDTTPFITDAAALVDEVCGPYYGEDKLTRIETWVAAHFCAIRAPRKTQLSVGGAITNMYESKVDLGLNLTRYGQQALRLDTGGYLAALDNALKDVKKFLPGGGKKMSMKWIGQDPVDWGT
jgi:hypothetical protein